MLMILYGLQFADKTSLSRGVIFVSPPRRRSNVSEILDADTQGLREDTGLTAAEYPNLTTFF